MAKMATFQGPEDFRELSQSDLDHHDDLRFQSGVPQKISNELATKLETLSEFLVEEPTGEQGELSFGDNDEPVAEEPGQESVETPALTEAQSDAGAAVQEGLGDEAGTTTSTPSKKGRGSRTRST